MLKNTFLNEKKRRRRKHSSNSHGNRVRLVRVLSLINISMEAQRQFRILGCLLWWGQVSLRNLWTDFLVAVFGLQLGAWHDSDAQILQIMIAGWHDSKLHHSAAGRCLHYLHTQVPSWYPWCHWCSMIGQKCESFLILVISVFFFLTFILSRSTYV